MALCSVFVIVVAVVNAQETFCCFQHIYLKVTTLMGGSYVCKANDFLFCHDRMPSIRESQRSATLRTDVPMEVWRKEGYSSLTFPFLHYLNHFIIKLRLIYLINSELKRKFNDQR